MKRLQLLLVASVGCGLLSPCLVNAQPVSALAPATQTPARVAPVKPSSPVSIVDRAALNPQPLPPGPPDPDRVRASRNTAPQKSATAAEKAGIIIIGGKQAAKH